MSSDAPVVGIKYFKVCSIIRQLDIVLQVDVPNVNDVHEQGQQQLRDRHPNPG